MWRFGEEDARDLSDSVTARVAELGKFRPFDS
jgi:hypothetical protein